MRLALILVGLVALADNFARGQQAADDQVSESVGNLAVDVEVGLHVLLHGERDVRVADLLGQCLPVDLGVAARGGVAVLHVVQVDFAASAETRRREYAPLQAIADNYPKYVLSLDPLAGDNSGGIRHLRIPDFLLLDAY